MGSEIEVVVPSVGESISEGSIGRWFYKDGDFVQKDEPLFELDSDKASMEVPAGSAGRLKILVGEGQTVQVGSTVAKIDTSASGPSASKAATPATKEKVSKEIKPAAAEPAPTSSSPNTAISDQKIKQFTPSQRKAIRHGKMEPTKTGSLTAASSSEVRTPMSPLRKTIAQRLLHSQRSNATLTTFNEIDMSRLMEVRQNLKDRFQKDFGIKLGFMSFFSSAVIHALREYPIVNSHIDGDDIVEPQQINLGIAVSTERGLVVPVVREADQLSYAGLEAKIAEVAEKARVGKLSIPDMQGGSFTITNGGVFGSLLSTPILNPPQSGILGMHKTEHRPVAIPRSDGRYDVAVRPMMYVALSYDHRLIDGATSVGFLVKIKEYIETVTEDQVFASRV